MLIHNFYCEEKANKHHSALMSGQYDKEMLDLITLIRAEGATNITSNASGIFCELPKPTYEWLECKGFDSKKETVSLHLEVVFTKNPILYCWKYEQGTVYSLSYKKAWEAGEGLGNVLSRTDVQLPTHIATALGLLDKVEILKNNKFILDYIKDKTGYFLENPRSSHWIN